ncbi:MAG: nuclear transport factor 2 family protein [Rhizomicrobium sp.]
MKRLVLAFLLFSTVPAMADGLPPDLVKATRDYDAAQARGDTATLSRLVADDFILVNSNAVIEDKRQFLADYHLPGFKIEPYVWKQKIAKVWSDGAVTGGLLHLHWTQDGKHQSRWLRIAYVWQKRNGHWQARYAQVTRVP